MQLLSNMCAVNTYISAIGADLAIFHWLEIVEHLYPELVLRRQPQPLLRCR